MVWTVSVRNVRSLEKQLRAGEQVLLPEECVHNSRVIQVLLKQYGPKVLPEISSLSDGEFNQVSGAVAYLVRTDTIKSGELRLVGPNPLFCKPQNIFGEDGELVHLLNDPSCLNPDWRIPRDFPQEYSSRGAEFFRCYSAAMDFLPKIKLKLDTRNQGIFSLAFPLADMTAYLLDPRDLTDYKYTPEEIARFHGKLAREAKEI